MRGLLTAWGAPAPTNPGGMGPMGGRDGMGQGQMPGMTSGTAFDRMFLQMMIVYHQGAIDMSQTELAQGGPPRRHVGEVHFGTLGGFGRESGVSRCDVVVDCVGRDVDVRVVEWSVG